MSKTVGLIDDTISYLKDKVKETDVTFNVDTITDINNDVTMNGELKSDEKKADISDELIITNINDTKGGKLYQKSMSFKASTSFSRAKIHILLLEKISIKAVNYLVDQGFTVETADRLTIDELKKKLPLCHVIGIRSKTKLREAILQKYAKKLLCIGHFCIGTDQTDLEFASTLGLPVFNSPFANTRSVAELVIANIILLSRKAGDQNINMHNGKWTKTAKGCNEVRGKTLGIIGYGHVGSQLSILAEALGLIVYYYDIIPKLPLGNAKSCKNLTELFSKCKYISLHVPYTRDTHNMISEREIKMMKKGTYLCNAARGKCVEINAVAKYLKNGHLAGAYFDVYPSEPTNDTLCLIDCPNTILSPHIGGSTLEAQENIGIEVANKITKFINEGCTTGAVNFPEVQCTKSDKRHRILNIHKNVPGVMKKINNILGNYNIAAQILQTRKTIGYLIIEVDADQKLSREIKSKITTLPESIKTRVLYYPGVI
mmetsp:Transcript_18202/g.22352  ORF Transcript_18202/g.22352 Transcript_18202/m.22352 type:complete len:487 (-) Transcript_18202:24-1484(-)